MTCSLPTLVAGPLLGAAMCAAGCASGDVTQSEANPCAALGCGEHAVCAIAADNTARCLCEPGYHLESQTCVVNVAGAECDGIDCGTHGACVVVVGEPNYPFCLCDQGYATLGDTQCLINSGECAGVACSGHGTCTVLDGGIPWCECESGYTTVLDLQTSPPGARQCLPASCTSSADCDAESVCGFETGGCTAASGSICGMPAADSGSAPLHATCYFDGAGATCATGLVCAVNNWGIDPAADHYNAVSGICLPACDPCNPTCADTETCFSLTDGGGFCATDLRLPDEPGGLHGLCARAAAPSLACHSTCRPETVAFANVMGVYFGTSEPSIDCGAGDLCVLQTLSMSGNQFTCQPGTAVPDGDPCAPDTGAYCRYPYTCWPILGEDTATYCTTACSQSNPCAAGWSCADTFCMRDGAGAVGTPCTEIRQCRTGLSCTTGHCVP